MVRRVCTAEGAHLPTARPAIMQSPTHSVRYRSNTFRRLRMTFVATPSGIGSTPCNPSQLDSCGNAIVCKPLSIPRLRGKLDCKFHQHGSYRHPVAVVHGRTFQTFAPSILVHCYATLLSHLTAVVQLVGEYLPGNRHVVSHVD